MPCSAWPAPSASWRRPLSGRGQGDRDPQTHRGRTSAKAQEALLKHCHQQLGLLPRLQPKCVCLAQPGLVLTRPWSCSLAGRARSKQPVPQPASRSSLGPQGQLLLQGSRQAGDPSHGTAAVLGHFLCTPVTEQKGKMSFSWRLCGACRTCPCSVTARFPKYLRHTSASTSWRLDASSSWSSFSSFSV